MVCETIEFTKNEMGFKTIGQANLPQKWYRKERPPLSLVINSILRILQLDSSLSKLEM